MRAAFRAHTGGARYVRWLFATLHLFALALGVPAIWSRGRALSPVPPDLDGLHRLFLSDTFWGVAAVLWIATGLIRAFGGLENGADPGPHQPGAAHPRAADRFCRHVPGAQPILVVKSMLAHSGAVPGRPCQEVSRTA